MDKTASREGWEKRNVSGDPAEFLWFYIKKSEKVAGRDWKRCRIVLQYLITENMEDPVMFFLIIYNLLFPIVFLFFLPALLWKLIRRPGEKSNYGERFGKFTREKMERLAPFRGCVWLHAVSVGETNLALTVLDQWVKESPEKKFVLSTTTTTAQEIAKKRLPPGVELIFCPIDFFPYVAKAFLLLRPSMLVIFETELWPNLINCARMYEIPIALVNARMSDHSFPGYRRFRFFFAPILRKFHAICVQTETDRERFLTIAPDMSDRVTVCGNIKFDQHAPAHLVIPDLSKWFGAGKGPVIIAASTHPEEELFLAKSWLNVRSEFPDSRLLVVPRHAERGAALKASLSGLGLKVFRKSTDTEIPENLDCLLADTTGELQGFLAASDIVVMGKTLAGNTEGQNIIEPAMLGKAIICGMELKNFRQALEILLKANSVVRVADSAELESALRKMLSDPGFRSELGNRAKLAIEANNGATEKNLSALRRLFPEQK